ncbi:hypothetical protein BHM03_00028368 [Ensete ventricosum]|nr:hypothetical protein BHM03_00028368 [Ensete ventricosum]
MKTWKRRHGKALKSKPRMGNDNKRIVKGDDDDDSGNGRECGGVSGSDRVYYWGPQLHPQKRLLFLGQDTGEVLPLAFYTECTTRGSTEAWPRCNPRSFTPSARLEEHGGSV